VVALAVAAVMIVVGVAQAFVGSLQFIGAKVQGVGGVDGIDSPDDVAAIGRNVYAVGGGDDGLATFKRRDGTGDLKFVNAKFDGVDGVDGLASPIDVAASPDRRSVYVTGSGDNAVATFKRNLDTGKLKFVNAKFNGTGGVSGIEDAYAVGVSPDSRNVYVTSDNGSDVATFKRDRSSGKLSFVNAKVNGVGGVEGIDTPDGIAVSADGDNVYVPGYGSDSLATFKRNSRSGKLRFLNAKFDGTGGVDGLDAAYEVTVSSDDRNVYVAGSGENAIATFKRNSRSGKLRFINAKFDGVGGVSNLVDPYDLVVSDDGHNLYVSAYQNGTGSALDTFKRDRSSGKVKFLDAQVDGAGGVDEVAGIWRVAISPDDRNLYVAAYDEPSVGTFKRHP
jgi:6-phosphogluconolactonase (cycloisomerase 2 family)